MKPFAHYKTSGQLWRAGISIMGLCSAWNHATNPARAMSDEQHKRSFTYARAIKARMARLGYQYGKHYRELSNGSLWPIKTL